MGVSKRLADAVMRKMPKNAELHETETEFEGTVLSIHWRLNNDPERPNKYSRTIIIRLTRELLEDFPNYPESMQETAVEKFESWIDGQLSAFDPDHKHSRYQQPPRIEWAISSGDIFAQ